MNELYALGTQTQWLVEEIVAGSTDGWYAEPGYGDYVSVEGIVADGVYHPLCITGRLPPVPPFMEVASTAPCALPEPLQRRIEDASRAAVDALRLDTCGTHTEIKLRADGELAVIETAARFGGVLITKEVEHVFGFDPIGALVRELLGERVDYPDRMLIDGHGAAASLAPIPADSAGNPWHTTPLWQPSTVHWPALLSPSSTIEQAPAFGGEAGVPVRAFDPAGGSGNWLGLFFLTATDAATLHRDCSAVLDGLESALA